LDYEVHIALSHHWTIATAGCYLTMDNYEVRQTGRWLEAITRVFQNAIDVAEELGVCYI
jgi:hypothetical protein